MKTQPITGKQKHILTYLYRFRFIHTHHIRKLLGHKNSNRTLEWMKDLLEKNYIKRRYNTSSLADRSKPAVYFLAPLARQILKKDEKIVLSELDYIYQEHRRNEKFINHTLFIVDMFLYFVSKSNSNEEIKFFTKNQLKGYEYFPDPLPDAFITIQDGETTRRYFLDVFDDYVPPFVIRNRVKMYLSYIDNSEWDSQTNSEPMPTVLFVFSNQTMQLHTHHYVKAVLKKSYDKTVSFYFTTKQKIVSNEEDVWEKVPTFDEE